MMADLVNAVFESAAAFFVYLSVRRVWQHRAVRGISIIGVGYFTLWGFWNLYYYPALGQPISAAAAIAVCVMNCAYLASLIYWRKQ